VTHAERLELLLSVLATGPTSLSQLARKLNIPVSSVWLLLHELLHCGKVIFHGFAPNPAPNGGSPQKLYCLAGTMWPKPIDFVSKQSKNGVRTRWKEPPPKTANGSGMIAGRITIGRGSRWGAGLV